MNTQLVNPALGMVFGFFVATAFSNPPIQDVSIREVPETKNSSPDSPPTTAKLPESVKDIADSETSTKVGRFDRIETREFHLVDNEGKSRLEAQVDRDGVTRVKIGNGTEGSRMMISVFPDNRLALLLQDTPQSNRIGLSLRDNGRPAISLDDNASLIMTDRRGRNRAVLRVSQNGDPSLRFYDEKGRVQESPED